MEGVLSMNSGLGMGKWERRIEKGHRFMAKKLNGETVWNPES